MTITHRLAPLTAVFLSRYVRHLRLRCVFRIHVVLQPFRGYARHSNNPRQTHPLQQQPIDQGFGFRTDRLPFRIFHELSTTLLTSDLRFPVVDVSVLDDLSRPAPWAGWHSFVLSFYLPPILYHYLYRTTHFCVCIGQSLRVFPFLDQHLHYPDSAAYPPE